MSAGVLFEGGPFRIATFIPDVTIEAVGQDALGITGFPAESGVTMTDHSFKLPVRLEMVVGWSDSTIGQAGRIQQIYQQLLTKQATRQPFSIVSSRRLYRNMLMESITDPITAATLNAMIPRITFRELIISRTRTASPTTAQPAADPASQANPESTGGMTDRGTVQTEAVTAQNFAGAYNPGTFNPGSFNPDGGSVGIGSFGPTLSGVEAPTPNGIDMSQMSGLSPATTITLPELSVTSPEPVGGLQGAGPDQYNMFGGGP